MPNRKFKVPQRGTLLEVKQPFQLLIPSDEPATFQLKDRYRTTRKGELLMYIGITTDSAHRFNKNVEDPRHAYIFLTNDGKVVHSESFYTRPRNWLQRNVKVINET